MLHFPDSYVKLYSAYTWMPMVTEPSICFGFDFFFFILGDFFFFYCFKGFYWFFLNVLKAVMFISTFLKKKKSRVNAS